MNWWTFEDRRSMKSLTYDIPLFIFSCCSIQKDFESDTTLRHERKFCKVGLRNEQSHCKYVYDQPTSTEFGKKNWLSHQNLQSLLLAMPGLERPELLS